MRQIFVDARDKTSGTSANFSITLPQTLVLESGHQGRIDDLRLPVTTPTIYHGNSGIYLTMTATGEKKELFIAEGNYTTGDALGHAIFSALAAPGTGAPGAWNVVYNPTKLSMTITGSNGFIFTGGSYMEKLLARPYTYDGTSYTFSYVLLQGLGIVYLCCSNFANLDLVGPKGASDCLCAIPITVGFGSVQSYSMSNSVYFEILATTTQSLSFQLRDRDNNLVHALQNVAFTLTID
jgi:hypothetical protein